MYRRLPSTVRTYHPFVDEFWLSLVYDTFVSTFAAAFGGHLRIGVVSRRRNATKTARRRNKHRLRLPEYYYDVDRTFGISDPRSDIGTEWKSRRIEF